MLQHFTVLISFIFALALTHVFSSASTLPVERERVRFSGLLATTMLNAARGLIINWLFLWRLESIKALVAGGSAAPAHLGDPAIFHRIAG